MITRVASWAMGTRFELVIVGDDEGAMRGVGEMALEEIAAWDARLSLFRTDSLVTRINTEGRERPVRVDAETMGLLVEAREVWEQSGGAFDITVGGVMKGLGFHDDASSATVSSEVGGMGAVDIEESTRTVRILDPRVSIDLGGIAKGHALDRAGEILRQEGVAAALLHGGTSSVLAIGAPADDDRGWPVAIGGGPRGSAPVIRLKDMALSVSGQHGRAITLDGEVCGHILDPSTGRTARGVEVACVVGRSARTVDAWSTAVVVRGGRCGMPEELTTVVLEGQTWKFGGGRQIE